MSSALKRLRVLLKRGCYTDSEARRIWLRFELFFRLESWRQYENKVFSILTENAGKSKNKIWNAQVSCQI